MNGRPASASSGEPFIWGRNLSSESFVVRSARLVNEGRIIEADVLIRSGRIEKIGSPLRSVPGVPREIDASGMYLLPGLIDDQVHFREPGLTHKATIRSESRAAVAGGVTSFMEMPNTVPPALTRDLLEDKYRIASKDSAANYSFYMGASRDNVDEILSVDPKTVCGVKIFLGSSTGDLLLEDPPALEKIFSRSPTLIAVHSENDQVVARNLAAAKGRYGQNIPASAHAAIRDVEACYSKTEWAVALAKKCGTRLHVFHLSTEEELKFFEPLKAPVGGTHPFRDKKITAEVCVHHLYFDADDYERLGNRIKCNPAIKEARHKKALFEALLDDRLDVIATDHAPHTAAEKARPYLDAPSGLPLVQHSLNLMLDFHQRGVISMEKIVEKMCHRPAELFQIGKRGFIREGNWADLVILDSESEWTVEPRNILYQCGWSPLEGKVFKGRVTHTFVSGQLVFEHGVVREGLVGERLTFDRS
ncbi:MAG: dihydroorotase [Spirochaetia bacterium]|nr:dihydroorotase [Spirochaetia bacterium]